MNELTEINKNLIMTIDIVPVPMEEAVAIAENIRLGVETNITNWNGKQNENNNFGAIIPHDKV